MIRLNKLTDYAIVLLSQMADPSRAVYAAVDLSEKTMLPLPTTSKILKQLTKSGLLSAQRGASGGYRLAREASAISVAAIVEALDGPIAITDCTDKNPRSETCRIEHICPMRSNWNRVNRAIRAALEELSLADMVTGNVALAFDDEQPAVPARYANA